MILGRKAIAAVFFLLLSLEAIAGEVKIITQKDNESNVILRVGDNLVIPLDTHNSYLWQIDSGLDGVILSPNDIHMLWFPDPTENPVNPKQVFVFDIVGKGTTTLTILEYRPWLKKETAISKFSIEVIVQ